MSKPFLLFRGPIRTRSGYGAHSRDLLMSLYNMDKYDIRIDSCSWGFTPYIEFDDNNLFHNWMKSNIVTNLTSKPDIYVQVTVPNEFNPIGKYNIGITAGIETTIAPADWVVGCNKMDLVIATSKFSSDVLGGTVYQENTPNGLIEHSIVKPIEVLFEGVDTNIFKKTKDYLDLDIKEDFSFLFVGHWLKGNLGEDRKNIGMLIRCFASAFAGKNMKPALILKTSSATYSVRDREHVRTKIEEVTKDIVDCPPIYLLFGDLTDEEMNLLYNNPKIKCMVSLTKGEGFGRPLLEFTMSGKPVMASNWSGHLDFLDIDNSVLIGGKLTDVDASAIDQFVVKNSKWFTANYEEVNMAFTYLFQNYDTFLSRAEKLRKENVKKFTMENMTKVFSDILERHVVVPKEHKLKLPELIRI